MGRCIEFHVRASREMDFGIALSAWMNDSTLPSGYSREVTFSHFEVSALRDEPTAEVYQFWLGGDNADIDLRLEEEQLLALLDADPAVLSYEEAQ